MIFLSILMRVKKEEGYECVYSFVCVEALGFDPLWEPIFLGGGGCFVF